MPDTTTGNLGLTKPEIGASADTWGNKINTDLDLVDALFAAAGTGTSVGVNVGAGKTIAVAGTLNVTGVVSGGIVAPLASPTFTGTVVLPSTTSIGPVSSAEIGHLDGVTSNIQTQLDAKLAISTAASTFAPLIGPTFTGTVTLPNTTSIGGVSAAEIVFLDGVTSNVQTQLDAKAGLASPAFTGAPTAPTAGSGTNTTQVASTAFVQQVALNNQLPLQTGNAGKFLTTDGSNASFASIPDQVYPGAGIAVSTGTGWGTSLSTPLGVANGGTGAATLPANNVLIGNGTSAVAAVAPGTAGNLLTSNGTTWTSAPAPASGTLDAIATGTLAEGSTVIINADGTVSAVFGFSNFVFESAETTDISAVYDSVNQKVVIAYVDQGNSRFGTAVVGTVSGTSISFGTPVVWQSLNVGNVKAVYDANAQKVVIAYYDTAASALGKAIVGTVSGTSMTFGAVATFGNTQNTFDITITYDQNAQKVVIFFEDGGNSFFGTARVGTVSGTTISFGTAVVYVSASPQGPSTTYDANALKVVHTYGDGGNSNRGTAIVGTVSGTNISFGTAVVFQNTATTSISAVYDPSTLKVVIAYANTGGSNFGTAIVGTVSGTNISFGTAVVFQSTSTGAISAAYDPSTLKVVIAYANAGNSNFGTIIVGTVSGTSISFGTSGVFRPAGAVGSSTVYATNAQKVVIAYRDAGNSNFGTVAVPSDAGYIPNLTSENFIGFSSAAYTNGQTATIQLVGSVNTAQSSLTPGQSYFVLTDGTLNLTAGSPSIFAGTAVAANKIIVKG